MPVAIVWSDMIYQYQFLFVIHYCICDKGATYANKVLVAVLVDLSMSDLSVSTCRLAPNRYLCQCDYSLDQITLLSAKESE